MAYTRWLATGAPVYEENIYGRGYSHLGKEMPEGTSRDRGLAVYHEHCAVCHGEDGEGLRGRDNRLINPPLWGDGAYNWGSGMSRIFTAAAFIHLNMPFGRGGLLSQQEAWDVALYINSHERPQDPRYTGDVAATRALYEDFHRFSLYGQRVDGHVLGDHSNTGEKTFLRPDIIRPRQVEGDIEP
jgi:thiosulfate dehydrogenase